MASRQWPMTRNTEAPRQSPLRCLVLAMLISLPASATAQPSDRQSAETDEQSSALQQLERIDRYEQRISELQRRNGPYDPSLSEPMQALSDAYLAAGQLAEARATLEERLQVHRVSQGLYSRQQIPVMESLLELQARQQEWEDVNDTLAGLGWLYDRAQGLDSEQRLNGLRQLSRWQLRLMTQAAPDQQARHLLERRRLREQAMELAEQTYDEDSTRLGEVSYERAMADLELALAIFADPDTAQALITDTEGIHGTEPVAGQTITTVAEMESIYGARMNTVSSRSFRRHMRNHFERISDMKDRFAEREDPEAEAMALLYMADSVLIRQQYELTPGRLAGPERGSGNTGSAVRYYRQAWELFLDSGMERDTLERHLGCPVRLPRQEFVTRLSELPECEFTEDGRPRLEDFHALSEVLPGVDAGQQQTGPGAEALLEFEVSINGQASRPDIESIQPDSTTSRVRIDEFLQDLQFQPALEQGSPRSVENVSMRMFLPPSS